MATTAAAVECVVLAALRAKQAAAQPASCNTFPDTIDRRPKTLRFRGAFDPSFLRSSDRRLVKSQPTLRAGDARRFYTVSCAQLADCLRQIIAHGALRQAELVG